MFLLLNNYIKFTKTIAPQTEIFQGMFDTIINFMINIINPLTLDVKVPMMYDTSLCMVRLSLL